MTLPNAPRRGKDEQRRDHFGYARLPHGDEMYGYLAGPILWVEVHQSDFGSKPCLVKLTGGELSCPKCKYGAPVQKGACPFWLLDSHTPHMVWLDDGRREVYDALAWARKLKFRREKLKGAPVWAHLCISQEPLFKSEHPFRKGPVDITRSLLTMWKMPELDMWYALTHGRSDTAVTPPPPPEPPPPPKKKKRGAKEPSVYDGAHVVAEEMRASGDDYDTVIRRLKERMGALPSPNGKHEPEG